MKISFWRFRLIMSTILWCSALYAQKHPKVTFLNTDSFDAYVTVQTPSTTNRYTVLRYGVAPLTLIIPHDARVIVAGWGIDSTVIPMTQLKTRPFILITSTISSHLKGKRILKLILSQKPFKQQPFVIT